MYSGCSGILIFFTLSPVYLRCFIIPLQSFAAIFCTCACMLVGATGTAFPILFTEPKNNTEQWQIKDTLTEGMVFF